MANRVSEILDGSSIDQWFYVNSQDNPADAGTRGMSADSLMNSSWIKGPAFLRTPDFPFTPGETARRVSVPPTAWSETSLTVNAKPQPKTSLFKDFSSYLRLLKAVAIALRWLPKHASHRKSRIDVDELRAAEMKVLLVTQHESFPDEHRKLHEHHPVSRKSPISRLSPFIGPGGLLRATGRIKRLADAEFDMKHPIILDGRHPVVKLLLIDSHSKFHHEGVEFLRAQLQQRFSILKLRFAVYQASLCGLSETRLTTTPAHDGRPPSRKTVLPKPTFH